MQIRAARVDAISLAGVVTRRHTRCQTLGGVFFFLWRGVDCRFPARAVKQLLHDVGMQRPLGGVGSRARPFPFGRHRASCSQVRRTASLTYDQAKTSNPKLRPPPSLPLSLYLISSPFRGGQWPCPASLLWALAQLPSSERASLRPCKSTRSKSALPSHTTSDD